ncbi:MAG TPA: outer membrane beta-barrel protein [Burkholderiales bacterium]|nr:outer membrane beta-barrel protein [Burkholderiales bacterium]
MAIVKISALAVLALTATGVALPAAAQPSDGWRMPYQSGFWNTGHVGAEIGSAKLDVACPPGATCDNRTGAFKLFAGGKFNNTFGGELSYLKTQDFSRSIGGELDMQAVNFSVLAGIPLGMNTSVFGKLGALWGHTEFGGASQNGWGPSFGLGAQIGITRGWAARLDWDRYRFKLPAGGGDRENIDTFMVGAQYTFGNPPR